VAHHASSTASACWGCRAEDLVDDARDRNRGVDVDPVRDALSRPVQPHDELALRGPRAPLSLRSLVEPTLQRGEVDVEDEDAVEQADEVPDVPGPPQKNVSACSWSETRVLTASTSHRWCSCR